MTSCESERALGKKISGKCGQDLVSNIVNHVLHNRDVKDPTKTQDEIWKLFLARLYLNLKWALGIEPQPVPPANSAFFWMMKNPFYILGPADNDLNDQFPLLPEDLEALKSILHHSPEAIDYEEQAKELGRTERTFKAMCQQYRRIYEGRIQEFPTPDLSKRVPSNQDISKGLKDSPDPAAPADLQQAREESDTIQASAEVSIFDQSGGEGSSSSQTSPDTNPIVCESDGPDQPAERSDEGNAIREQGEKKSSSVKRSKRRRSAVKAPDKDYSPQDPTQSSGSSSGSDMDVDETGDAEIQALLT